MDLEQRLLGSISGPTMMNHLATICQWDRLSGGSGEAEAVDYIVRTLQAYGLPVAVHELDAYVSNPVEGRLEVDGQAIPAKTRAFSATADGVTGELVYVQGGTEMFKDTETKARIEALDLAGKILLPRIPVVQITGPDGQALRRRLEAGEQVTATMSARTETGWKRMRLPVTEIAGQTDEFVLIAGHIDSWHLGVTDNGTGNVACLELARTFQELRSELKRGVRIAWWTGHSNARYAGSTWYADHFWHELHGRCVGYINIDSPGSKGATDYALITAVAENAGFLCGVVQELTGQQVNWERPVRAGDQSFWGCGLGWWWHTEHDTMDKAEEAVLVKDTQIYGLTALRLCQAEVLPYDLGALTDEFLRELHKLQALAGEHFDLGCAIQAVEEFLWAHTAFEAGPPDPERHNKAMLKALRLLTPVNYTMAGPFEHDAAAPAKPIPGLQGVARLAGLDPKSDAYGFLKTRLIRERNRLCHAFAEATEGLS